MKKIIVTENQFKRIFETGAANAAMDLDIYVQPVNYDTSDGNENLNNSLDEVISNLKELKNLFSVGKKIKSDIKNEIFRLVDNSKAIYDKVKEKP